MIKSIKLSLLLLAGLFGGQRFHTANGAAATETAPEDPLAEIKSQIADLTSRSEAAETENAALKAQLAKLTSGAAAPAAAPDGMLAMLCKGAGLTLGETQWRVNAGLTPQQAVQAALVQRKRDAARAAAAKSVSTAKAKAAR